jgi:hypothetical protein
METDWLKMYSSLLSKGGKDNNVGHTSIHQNNEKQ